MPRLLNIPESAHAGLNSLITISEDAFQELTSLLDEAIPSLNISSTTKVVTNKASIISRQEATAIIEAASTLSVTYVINEVNIQKFVQDVIDGIERGLLGEIDLADEKRQLIVTRLSALLNLSVFKVGVKATSLLNEQQHNLLRARILTDIRPVFGDEVTETPVGMIVVHTLKVEYLEGEEYKEFYIAMDTDDVDLFIDTFERAKSKATVLKALLAKTEVNIIDYSWDES